jgi:hypothetical protein
MNARDILDNQTPAICNLGHWLSPAAHSLAWNHSTVLRSPSSKSTTA